MNRTRTSIALATAAMCATVLVSNAGAQQTNPGPAAAPVTSTVFTTTTTTPLVTTTVPHPTGTATTPATTTEKASDTRSILQAFSSGDFSGVSTAAVITFVIGIITGILNFALQFDPAQVQAMVDQVTAPFQATLDQVRTQLPF